MTKAQLLAFTKRRNKSEFQTNLQFEIDLNECGLKVADLGPVKPLPEGGGYEWQTPHGRLVEFGGVLEFQG